MNEKELTDEVYSLISKADPSTQLAVMQSVKQCIINELSAKIDHMGKERDTLQKYLGEFQKI